MIERNLVLLGGELAPALGGADGAYLLRRAGVEEARAVAAEDPLVAHGVSSPECVEWRLVGINPDAIGPSTVVRPGDV